MVSATTGLAVAVCVSPGPARKATLGSSVTRHPGTVVRVGCPSTATRMLSAASMTQQGWFLWRALGWAHRRCTGTQQLWTRCTALFEEQPARYQSGSCCFKSLKLLFCSLLAFTRGCSICVPFVLMLLRCICMDGYEGDGFSCQPIDLCSQPERGGCSRNVSGRSVEKQPLLVRVGIQDSWDCYRFCVLTFPACKMRYGVTGALTLSS